MKHCLTAVENLDPVEQLVAAYGSENFIIGTDFPHPEYQRLPNGPSDILEKGQLSEVDKVNILGGNVARFLRLD
jgi:predicted TIM-barrel fold metal-dependent hydrolase